MDFPKYNGGSVNEYMRKVDMYNNKIISKKYNFILDFINEWFELTEKSKYVTLTDFKNISEKLIKENKEIIDINKEKIKNILSIDIEDEIDFIIIIRKILKVINYSIGYRTNNNIKYYSIKQN